MSVIEAEDALGRALDGGKVRRKANNTSRLQTARRVVQGSLEVMVKVTGFGKGAAHIKAHLSYITRNATLELETDRGDVVRGKEALKDLLKAWAEDIGNAPRHKRQRDTLHLVLSMPAGTPETAVRHAARNYAQHIFSANHEYVFALHTDEPHPHIHLTVKMQGFDGRRLNPRKADLQDWREAFARAMRDQGIEAEATPRSVRGVVRKAENSIVRHIERGGGGRDPRVPRVRALRNQEIAEELIAESKGQALAEKPWEPRIRQLQQTIRSAWQSAADALEKNAGSLQEHSKARPAYDRRDIARVRHESSQSDQLTDAVPPNKALAAEIRAFVQAMPPIETQGHALKQRLANQFQLAGMTEPLKEKERGLQDPIVHPRKTQER